MTYVGCLRRGSAPMPDRPFRETFIARHVEEVVNVTAERAQSLPPDAELELLEAEFGKFAAFAEGIGVAALPATGHVAAFYVLDLLANDASMDEIGSAVAAIKFAHEINQHFLDWCPIAAVLDFAAAEIAATQQAQEASGLNKNND